MDSAGMEQEIEENVCDGEIPDTRSCLRRYSNEAIVAASGK